METEIDFWWNNLQADQRQWYIETILIDQEWEDAGVPLKNWAYANQATLSAYPDFPPTIYRRV